MDYKQIHIAFYTRLNTQNLLPQQFHITRHSTIYIGKQHQQQDPGKKLTSETQQDPIKN